MDINTRMGMGMGKIKNLYQATTEIQFRDQLRIICNGTFYSFLQLNY